jgi:small subunit ribosomal protein S2
MSASQATLRQLLSAGVHIGHKTSAWNPKMRPYIYGERNGMHIVDLQQSAVCLQRALEVFRAAGRAGLRQLWLGPKDPFLESIVRTRARQAGAFTLSGRWVGGTLTNPVASRQILRLGGHLPDLIFCVDAHRHRTALREARIVDIPSIAVIDTDCDPDWATYIVPGNDESARAIDLYCALAVQATLDGLRERIGKVPDADATVSADRPARDHDAGVLQNDVKLHE